MKVYRRVIVERRKAEFRTELRVSENKKRAVWKIIKKEAQNNTDIANVLDTGIPHCINAGKMPISLGNL